MAAVDRFDFLFREFSQVFGDVRDLFALLGTIYAAKKTIKFASNTLSCLNEHIFCKLSPNCDLSQKFGPWAGNQ